MKVDIKRVADIWDSCGSEVSFLDVYGNIYLDETLYMSNLPGQPANTRTNVIWDFNIAKQNPIVKMLTEHAEAYSEAVFTPEHENQARLEESDVDSKEEWLMYNDPTLRVAFALVSLDFGPLRAAEVWEATV